MGGVRIDEVMGEWDFRERHARTTAVPPDRLLAATEQLAWADVPVLSALMRLRSAGRIPRDRRAPILDAMTAIGFTTLARTDDELVVGAIGRPWKPTGGGSVRLRDAASFAAFQDPGWAKMVANFHVRDGKLSTETRVLLTDARSRRAFRRYWIVVRPFSGLIRRRWLAAIAARAGA
jgi:hypothetical protein